MGGLEDERERGRLLERELVRERVDVRLRDGDQLGMSPVHVLADDGDRVAVLEPRVDDDALAAVLADARAVGSQDPRLRHRRKPFPNPEVEMVQRRRAQTDDDLVRPGFGLRGILVAQYLGSAVLVNPDRLHAGTISYM